MPAGGVREDLEGQANSQMTSTQEEVKEMERYPILFGRHELIEGNGFIARVEVSGRALLSREDGEEFWVEGINPGGFAGKGASPGEALASFCEELRVVLFDIALETSDFDAFKAEVERFFQETNQPALLDWEAAVNDVRDKKVSSDWLIQRPADSPRGVNVVLVRTPNAINNQEGDGAAIAVPPKAA